MYGIIGKTLKENEYLLWNLSQDIWKNPELSLQENYAHNLLATTLENFGFEVCKHYILPTAFRAEFSTGKDGPTIALICEYDALPMMGHACGHNLIAEIGVAAGIAVKASMEKNPEVGGKIVVLGTPAEEGGGGKIKLIEKGAFKNIDAALMAHPQVHNRLYPLILDLARITVKYRIRTGVDPFENLNAVDAAVACYNNVAIVRRSLNSKWRISVIIRRSSGEESELCFSYRAPTRSELSIIRRKLNTCIETAAATTDCLLECDVHHESNESDYRGMVTNKAIAKTFCKYAESKGVVFVDNDPRICESAVSTDMGNVSHVVPSIHPEYSIGAAPPDVNHTPGFAKAAGASTAQRPTLDIAESLAETAIRLMSDSRLMEKVREEFNSDPDTERFSALRHVGE